MKSIAWLFGLIGVFLIPVGLIYGFMSKFSDLAGFPAIMVTAIMCLFLSGFLFYTDKLHPDQPSDNEDGEIIDAAGDYGFYSPWSWWPIVIAAVCALLVIGLALGWWIVGIALPLSVLACVGWVYEYNRGDHAH
ncbi:cytochrome c oxidase subunit 4 [Rothia sp. P7181]|uniref:cytochrome c oxidase subunit 4 n=1 Tax=Rothia sp. P7181 TaxID=3402663 RepID=UPI003AE0D426